MIGFPEPGHWEGGARGCERVVTGTDPASLPAPWSTMGYRITLDRGVLRAELFGRARQRRRPGEWRGQHVLPPRRQGRRAGGKRRTAERRDTRDPGFSAKMR